MKSASIAHKVASLAESDPNDAFLVVCGSSHMMYGHGMPERLFHNVADLRGSCYRILARQVTHAS